MRVVHLIVLKSMHINLHGVRDLWHWRRKKKFGDLSIQVDVGPADCSDVDDDDSENEE